MNGKMKMWRIREKTTTRTTKTTAATNLMRRKKTLSIRTSASYIIQYFRALTHQKLIKRKRKSNIFTLHIDSIYAFTLCVSVRSCCVVLCFFFSIEKLQVATESERQVCICVCYDVHEYRSLCKRSVLLSLVSHRLKHAVQSVCYQLRVSSYALNVVHFVKPISNHSSKFYRSNKRVSLNYTIKIILIIHHIFLEEYCARAINKLKNSRTNI